MNKKVKRALYITGLVLGIVVLVLYIVFPEKTEYYFNCVKDFINRPLPIVGVSIAIIGHFIYKIILMTKFGEKKITELRNQDESLKEELLQTKEELKKAKEEIEKVSEFAIETQKKLQQGFSLSSNVKIKSLIKKEEEKDGESTISTND